MDELIESLVGGFLIGLGGTCFLVVDNKTLGALLFSLGLLAICSTGQLLYTGKVSYSRDIRFLLKVLFFNLIGAMTFGFLIGSVKPELREKATLLCQNKLLEGNTVIILGFLCNILIYFAVEGYAHFSSALLILCVMAFILCGFEHSIANMFYFSVAGKFGIKEVTYLLLNVLGNTTGGILVQVLKTLKLRGK